MPEMVERIFRASDRHHARPTAPTLTYRRLLQLLADDGDGEVSQSTVERTHRYWSCLFPHWPLRRGDVRPWLADPSILVRAREEYAAKKAAAGSVAQRRAVEQPPPPRLSIAAFDESGNVVPVDVVYEPESGLYRLLPRLAQVLAVGLSTAAALDLSDGRLDHIVRWCRVLMEPLRLLM